MIHDKISPETLRELIDYDPATGAMTWRERPESMFKEGPRRIHGWLRWNRHRAGRPAGCIDSGGYLAIRVLGTIKVGHRVAWAIHYGAYPKNQIDHINGDRSDNRIVNLRDVPPVLNSRNRSYKRQPKYGHLGIKKYRGKWAASIGVAGQATRHLGQYDTLDEAIEARKAAEKLLGYHPNHGREANQ